jgi:DNA-binding CsgD family transcriptional regulator
MARTAKILERDLELKRLRASLAEARRGGGRIVLIEGEAGIGKTALLDHALASARRRGFEVLTARAGPLEKALGHGIAVQLFEEPVRMASASRRRKLLAGSAELAAPLLAGPPHSAEELPRSQLTGSAAQHGLYWLAANMTADAPLAIGIDDAQWCDQETLRWLHYLERRIDQLPVAILLTVRTGDPETDVDLVRAIAAEPNAETLKPGPLSAEAVQSILERSYGTEVDPAFSSACREWTAGNPFLLTELADELASEGVAPSRGTIEGMRGVNPDSISRSALLRLARLGVGAAALAGALAVLGSGLDLSEAAGLAGLSDADARSAADALIGAAILKSGRRLGFAHPVIENAIYAESPAIQRAADHRRAAGLLRARGAAADRIAIHLLRTDPGGDPWTADTLREAARIEVARGAPATAAGFLERALEEPVPDAERIGTLLELGFAEDLAGRAGVAEDRLREALELADSPRRRAEVALELAATLTRQGRFDDACAVLRAQLEHAPDAALRLSVEVQLCLAAQFASGGGWREAQARLERLAHSLSGATADGRAGLAALAVRRGQGGEPARSAIEPAVQALAASFSEDGAADVVLQGSAITVLVRLDALDEAEAGIARALERSRAVGSRVGVSQALYLQGMASRSRGELAEAAAEIETAIGVVDQYRPMLAKALGVGLLVDVLSEQGKLEAAGEQLASRDLLGQLPQHAMFGGLLESRGRWRWTTGDLDGALRDLTEAGRRHARWGSISPAFTSWRSASALVWLAKGEREEAARLVGEELALAQRVGSARPIGVGLWASGLVAGGEAGIELLRKAVDALQASPSRLEHARALTDLGAALRRAGSRADAREPLRDGLEIAESCGAIPLATRAREELSATGARPRSIVRSGVEELTPSELRVCRMAAEGMSNPEIAQALFITRATVESHLHSAYTKLGIGSRRELGAALSPEE